MKEHNLLDFIFIKFNHRILRPLFRVARLPGQKIIQNQFLKEKIIFGLNKNKERETKITVSLTTFPDRFFSVKKTLVSILNQTTKADRIIVWLGSDVNIIPNYLLQFEKYGITFIRKTENLMPHKKYFYAMQEFPDDIIITIDDDVIYQKTLIEDLLKTYKKHPDCICANRVHFITKKTNGTLHNYNNWINDFRLSKKPSYRLLPTGVGGVLYPPHSIPRIAFNIQNIKNVCLEADDIWLKFTELINHVKVVWSPTKHQNSCCQIQGSQKISLSKENTGNCKNDEYIAKCEKFFGTTLQNLISSPPLKKNNNRTILKRRINFQRKNKFYDFTVACWQFIKAQKESLKTTKFIKEKKQKNRIIKVAFIIYFTEAFSSFKYLYELLKNDKRFSVLLLCQPTLENINKFNDSYEFLKNQYPEATNAYKNSEWYDLKKFSPDYVFYTRPYNPDYYEKYKASAVRKYSKVCYITYAYNLENCRDHNFNFVNNFDFLQDCAFIFSSTNYERKILKNRFLLSTFINSYPKILFLGFPRFDLYFLQKANQNNNKVFTILYTPRWASHLKKANQASSFLEYVDYFYVYAEKNPDCNIIIRPHPLMFSHFIDNNIVERDYFEKLENKFKILGNIFFDKQKDYSKSLEKADVFVSDYTSLLAEYFITGKPTIYLGNLSLFNSDTKKMCKTFCLANSWEKIEYYIEKIRTKKVLSQKNREIIFSKIIKNFGSASKNIHDFLLKDYSK